MDAAFASPRPNPVQRRPAKIVLPTEEQPSSRLYRRSSSISSGESPTKVHLSYIPPGYRTPPYTPSASCSSSGGSSPTSVSPSKPDATRFAFDARSIASQHHHHHQQHHAHQKQHLEQHHHHQHAHQNQQHAPNSVYMANGASVQLLSLKTHRHEPPKQLLTLAAHQQQSQQHVGYAQSESGYSNSSSSGCATYCSSIYGSHCQHEAKKQLLNLRSYANSEVAASQEVCAFCYQFAVHYCNARGQTPLPRVADRGYWRGHVLKEGDRIVCPRLLRRVCALCGATGQNAHLNNYCPVTKKHTSSY